MKTKKFEIPKTPERRIPNVQPKKEREERLSKWEELLKLLPYCFLEKGKDGPLDVTGSPLPENVKDDLNGYFEDALLVLSTCADLMYHDMAYAIFYFCFTINGKFKIIYEGNFETFPELDDLIANSLYKTFNEHETAESWIEGYNIVVKAVEEAFKNGVSEPPKKS